LSPVKPIKLARTSIKYILGTGVSTHADQWKDDPTIHKGIPSVLTVIPEPEVRKGEDADGTFSEVIVPEVFGPGSIMLFETDMQVSSPLSQSADLRRISPATSMRSVPRMPTQLSQISISSTSMSCSTALMAKRRMPRVRSQICGC
jgi:hypothetical protein